ncbi:hypothetical protein D3C79_1065460 [compost metagenome]
MSLSSWVCITSLPGWHTNACNRANSLRDRGISSPCRLTLWLLVSRLRPQWGKWRVSPLLAPARCRNSTRIRAIISPMPNGLLM